MSALGSYLREKRMALDSKHSGFSIRAVAQRIGIHHSYLSKLERGEHAPLTEERIIALARDLGEDEDLLLALGGRIPARLARLIQQNPTRYLRCILDLEQERHDEGTGPTYAHRLAHRKKELEQLAMLLRDEIKGRQVLERQLVLAEAEKRTILANLKDVAVEYIDAEFTLLWASPSVEEHLSCPLDLALGRKCHEVAAGRDTPCPHCIAKDAIATGEIQEGDHTSADGRRWVVRSVPLKDSLGQVAKVVHFGFNVTELNRTRQALEKSERRWRFALEGAQEGVWDWDARTGTVYYSRRWKELLGYEEHEIGAQFSEWDSRIHPDDHAAVREAMALHVEGHSPHYESEHRLRCKDGSYKWVLARGTVVERAEDGAPLRALGTLTDMTLRREQEETIRKNEAFLKALLTSIQEGITVLDTAMTVQYVNPVIERWHPEKLPILGRKCYEVFHGRSEPCLKCPTLRAVKSRKSEWDLVEIDTTSSVSSLEVYSYPIIDERTGEVKGAVEFVRDVTDKRRIQSVLQETEGRYRRIFEKNPTMQMIINPETGCILDANAAFVSFYGYTLAELTKLNIADINVLSEADVLKEMHLAQLETRNFFNFRHRLKDGTVRQVEVSSTPVPLEDRTVLHSLIVDVTERNEALHDLAEERNRFRTLVERAPIGICTVSASGRLLEVNAALASIHGYDSPQQMLASVRGAAETFANPADHDRLLELLRSQTVISNLEVLAKRRDGTPFWTSRTDRATLDSYGELKEYVAFIKDIEARKRGELASETARRQLLGVLEQLEAGVYVVNPESRRIIYSNGFMTRAMGFDVTGRDSCATLLKNPGQCPFLADKAGFRSAGDTLTRELLFANDRWYYCTAKRTAWIDDSPAVVVVAMDITASRQAEEMKVEIDRIMRHDLRNPLNAIINLPKLLTDSPSLGKEESEMLLAISCSGQKMLNLIDASLSLHKLEVGTYAIHNGWIDLTAEVRAIRQELLHLTADKNVRIHVETGGDDGNGSGAGVVRGDKVLVPFLLSNLIKNAVEAAPEGSIVTVATARDSAQRITVHNRGTVDAAIRDRFFDKYATHGKLQGTGLGTYSSKLIAAAHGGDITMTSSEEEGTTVVVTLPQAE
ncbi:MAG: PAS domain S-box protein [Desulfovibrionaceae bacterium]